MKNLSISKMIIIFTIVFFQCQFSFSKSNPYANFLELSGTIDVQVSNHRQMYDYLKDLLTMEYCATDHFTGLSMNKNEKYFRCEMEYTVSIKKGLKKQDYLFTYKIHFQIRNNAYQYKITNFSFCPVRKTKNDENCTQLTSLIYSGKNKVKIEKQMKSIAITKAEITIQELIRGIEEIS